MEKFGMTFGGGPDRKELLETLESQKKQLSQYQSRFKDLLHAYKSLLKEKEALEASLEALGASRLVAREHGEGGPPGWEGGPPGSEGVAAVGPGSAREDRGPLADARDPGVCPADRLDALAGALATVTREKSRMEAGFRADRRQLKREADELRERLAALDKQRQAETRDLREQLAESRALALGRREPSDRSLRIQEPRELPPRPRPDAEPSRVDSTPGEEGEGAEPAEGPGETAESCRADREEARAHAAELRVAALEQRVTELSDLLGACEKARRLEQREARTLRERMARSDTEKHPGEPVPDAAAPRDDLDIEKPPPATQNSPDAAGEPEAVPSREELRRLKDELEDYKRQAKAEREKAAEDARRRLEELGEKYVKLRAESHEAAASHRELLREERRRAAAQLHESRQEAEREGAARRDEILRLEAELRERRRQTAALLDDKDRQLERLRAAAAPDPPPSEGELVAEERPAEAPWPAPLLYAERLARKEAEAEALRRQKRRLEDDLRRLRERLLDDAGRRREEMLDLKARLDAAAREQKREGANVEYLKNVIYKFLTLPDAGGRRQTLDAILAILHFSPQEKHCVLGQQGASWWSGRKR
ncbi:GRIP and coiled-coil domain-containing protein 1 [Corythoichthys intestinalis]|uniref:GRIP and coiled-coil domain-containing protein 1 n=1 Tax=Corythoichthys intestinalis TaxID=161448 RepID=UPI0025A4CF6F|nr:GRIP and coiled-coil domain-containing protein 1 [Corythoichthys intestinalis]